jgi:hypothetical protein
MPGAPVSRSLIRMRALAVPVRSRATNGGLLGNRAAGWAYWTYWAIGELHSPDPLPFGGACRLLL